ncbi:MAG: CotH kinase family protein [Oscillospiraceae bacterium]|nr:CotH kinase family protein [Oscillospiraceae bacterium]
MKRFLAFLCAFVVCTATFTACGSKDTDKKETTTTTTAVTTTKTDDENKKPDDNKEEEKPQIPEVVYPPVDQDLSGDASVLLSCESGIYSEEFTITLSAVNEGEEIYYTTDGSNPTTSETAIKYEGGEITITDRKNDENVVSAVDTTLISGNFNKLVVGDGGYVCNIKEPKNEDVDKCTVVRAVAKNAEGSYGAEGYATYFIGTMEEHIEGLKESCEAAGHDLAVISMSVNFDDFFGSERGIYVKGDIFDKAFQKGVKEEGLSAFYDAEKARSLDANYKQKGSAWEREARISFFEVGTDGVTEVLNQTCGVRVQGNYSRSDIQKGLRIYARDKYGAKNFKYAVFGEDYLNDSGEVMDKFKTLVLRAGGNCAFTAKFNDTFWQSLVTETACETKNSRPCVLYLNGEYWGLYVLEEDYSNDFFEDKHNVNKDDVVVYKGDAEALALGYKLDEGDLPEGETDETYYFHELLEFFENHSDLESDEDFNKFAEIVDTESVKDYFLIQCFINNKWDWPGKNWSMWKTTTENADNPYNDGRWRFMFYDMEFGGVMGGGEAGDNTIKNANYKDKGLLDMDTNNPAVLCFAYAMTNETFRNEFKAELEALPDGIMEKENALAKLQEFEDIYSPLYDQFFDRYEGTGSADDAVNGGYATVRCIRDFLQKRENNISRMVKYVEKILE